MRHTRNGLDGFRAAAGQELDPGEWFPITQERIDASRPRHRRLAVDSRGPRAGARVLFVTEAGDRILDRARITIDVKDREKPACALDAL